ncbi:MAG: hypothetical protein NTV68_05345 [Methanomicrobiales archaeon]|nr:hypothetical protein [Methanomicrobiales archaeon]
MVELVGELAICIVTLCFGLLISFQLAHIYHVRRITRLARRCVDSGTLAPVLVELEKMHQLNNVKDVDLDESLT